MKHLNRGVTVYVPERLFDTARFGDHLDQLAVEVGGYTTSEVMAGWRGADGTVVDEEVVCVEVLFSSGQRRAVCHRVTMMIIYLLQQGEAAVLVKTQGTTTHGVLYHKSDLSMLLLGAIANA